MILSETVKIKTLLFFGFLFRNLVCEIKSDYYYKLDESKNICKKEYTIKSGYNFEL